MRTSSPVRLLVCVVVSLTPAMALAQSHTHPAASGLTSHIMVLPGDVQWGACPPVVPPGAQCATVEGDPTAPDKLFAFRVKMPSGFRLAPHYHPADEHVLVLAGTFTMGLGERFDQTRGTALTAGSFAVMPQGTRHFAWTEGETILQIYAIGPWGMTYVNPEDDPRNKKTTAQ